MLRETPTECRVVARKSRGGVALGESAVRGEAAVRRTQPNGLRMTQKRHVTATLTRRHRRQNGADYEAGGMV
jgi:hypothetical protein